MADRFPLLTDEQIAKALAGAGLQPEDYREDGQIEPLARAIESATRTPLLAEVERLTAERDAALADAERWRYAMDWNTTEFAVCKRVGGTWGCWEPIKTSGPLDVARKESTNG